MYQNLRLLNFKTNMYWCRGREHIMVDSELKSIYYKNCYIDYLLHVSTICCIPCYIGYLLCRLSVTWASDTLLLGYLLHIMWHRLVVTSAIYCIGHLLHKLYHIISNKLHFNFITWQSHIIYNCPIGEICFQWKEN